jgi:hypothetical protein
MKKKLEKNLTVLRHKNVREPLVVGRTKSKTPIPGCRMGWSYVKTRSGRTIFKKYIGNQKSSRKSGRCGKIKKLKNKESGHSNQVGRLKKVAYGDKKHVEWVKKEFYPDNINKYPNGHAMQYLKNNYNEKAKKCGIKVIQ